MSEERITLELLGARMMALTADMKDVQLRLTALESRFSALETTVNGFGSRLAALETRFAVQEERMTRMLAFIVRIAERFDGSQGQDRGPPSGKG
ncbi:MAG: hypothetical protein ACREFK_03665 [Stellaceae bacterium]